MSKAFIYGGMEKKVARGCKIIDALELFKKATIREDHRYETDTQKEHYEFSLIFSGDDYREFIKALNEDKKIIEAGSSTRLVIGCFMILSPYCVR